MKKRVKFFLVALIILSLFVGGCTPKNKENKNDLSSLNNSLNSSETDNFTDFDSENLSSLSTSSTVSEKEFEPDRENIISITTTGGAVIVGMIDRDDKGWYITPENLLDVELNCFVDNPLYFEKIDRINMFEYKDDGFDKSLYIGKIVTIEGELKIYRDDFETLYLLPYSINFGKTVEKSYAFPELEYPETPINKYDPSKPLPDKVLPKIENGKYFYNYYMLSLDTIKYLGNDFADFWVDFVDAYLGYETTVYCPNKDYAEMLSSVIYYDFPLFSADCKYSYIENYNIETNTITLNYTSAKEEHNKIISDFTAAANEYLSGVSENMSSLDKAKQLYHALSSAVKYDYEGAETRLNIDAYYAYVNKSGICVTFAIAYTQLLNQVGVENHLVSGTNSDNQGHAWTIVNLNGLYYFCDPTYEASMTGGEQYKYFGMNYADRISDGTGQNGMTIGTFIFYDLSELPISENSLLV